MVEVNLTIHAPDGTRQITMAGDRLAIGRGDESMERVDDPGLSRLHASICRAGDRVWLLDEQSTNGSFVNGGPVPDNGKALSDGDKITIGDSTVIWVSIKSPTAKRAAATADSPTRLPLAASIILAGAVLILIAALGMRWLTGKAQDSKRAAEPETTGLVNKNAAPAQPGPAITSLGNSNAATASGSVQSPPVPMPTTPHLLYRDMSLQQRMEFITQEARRVSLMVGTRPCDFPEMALTLIKRDVDSYASRTNNHSTRTWGEDLNRLFERARQYAPLIIRAFRKEGVNAAVGLYIVMIESEYGQHCYDNFAGAMGMFQFIGSTARAYNVDPADRCNPDKMAPAAARYMRERIVSFGGDATGVGLAIAGYNRNPDSVRRDLQDVINSENKDRNFWTLIANQSKLDHWFQENKKYVPKFFAAAIVGENPQVFGVQMRALSTYEEPGQN